MNQKLEMALKKEMERFSGWGKAPVSVGDKVVTRKIRFDDNGEPHIKLNFEYHYITGFRVYDGVPLFHTCSYLS